MYALNNKIRRQVVEKLLTVLQKEFNLTNNEANIALLDALAFIIAVRSNYKDRAEGVKIINEYLPVIVEEQAASIHSTSTNPTKCSVSN